MRNFTRAFAPTLIKILRMKTDQALFLTVYLDNSFNTTNYYKAAVYAWSFSPRMQDSQTDKGAMRGNVWHQSFEEKRFITQQGKGCSSQISALLDEKTWYGYWSTAKCYFFFFNSPSSVQGCTSLTWRLLRNWTQKLTDIADLSVSSEDRRWIFCW